MGKDEGVTVIEAIACENLPAAAGPYSQAVRAGNMIFTSGQLGINPSTGKLVEGGNVSQARQALKNLAALLEAAGTGMDMVVKTTFFVTNMCAFSEVNEFFGEFFPARPPARTTVEVVRLPLGALIEIEAVAIVPG